MSDGARIEALWRSLSGGLLGWFRARGAAADEAEDLLSETFVRVAASVGQVQDEERYAAWVRRVARNVWVDARRRPSAAQPLGDVPQEGADGPGLEQVVAGWLEPALAELGDDLTAQVLRRTELGGETQAAVAADLGLGLGAVKARVRRGRRRLRERLEACCTFEFDRRGGLLEARRRRDDCEC